MVRSALRSMLVAALALHGLSCPGRVTPPDTSLDASPNARSNRGDAPSSAAEPHRHGPAGGAGERNGDPSRDRGREPAETMSYLGADWLTRPERIEEEQPDKMLDALGIRPGMSVADIGAGVGYHAIRMASRVGPEGRVYATDIQEEMLAMMRKNLQEKKITNVIPILSSNQGTGLAPASVDLVLMVDVYHELSEPERFLAALTPALRPGARVVLVEFRAEDPNVPIREEHKMTADQAIKELGQSGFRLVDRQEFLPWQHILIFSRAERSAP